MNTWNDGLAGRINRLDYSIIDLVNKIDELEERIEKLERRKHKDSDGGKAKCQS